MAAFDNTAPQALSATSFGIAVVGDTTNANAVIANIAAPTIALLAVGMGVRGPGIPRGTTITAKGEDSITLSANATATAAAAALTAHAIPQPIPAV